MKGTKHFLSLALALIMTLTLFPMTASANQTTVANPTVVADSIAIALGADGSVWTWGLQYNNGKITAGSVEPKKMIDGGCVAVDVAEGRYWVALKADGTLWTWGLYNGDERGFANPTQIDTGVSQLCCSESDFKYAKSDGTLWRYTFEKRYSGGFGSPEEYKKLMEGYISYASGSYGSGLALKSDGSLWEWSSELNKVFDNVASFSVSNDGANYTMILKDGSLWTMGSNSFGQIGDGTGDWDNSDYLNEKKEPVKIMDGVAMASVNSGNGAAVKTDGSLWVWGIGNNRALLGQAWQNAKDGEHTKFYSPQKLIDSGIAAVTFDHMTIIALKQDGTLLSWGDTRGALGYDASKLSSSVKDDQKRYVVVPQTIPGISGVQLPSASTTPTQPTNPPASDTPSSWAVDQVNAAIKANLVPEALQSKYTQDTTRAEFCALAVALYESVTGSEITGRSTFTDTTDVNVEKAASIEVVTGVGDNKFDPNGKLNREQAAVMLARLAEAVGKPLSANAPTFADNSNISTWASAQVGQIQAAGVMGGVGNNTFAPKNRTHESKALSRLCG